MKIVGAGVSGLFCAYQLIKNGFEVELYEKENSFGKKFLLAGKSGLNVTSNYPKSKFHNMYFENADIFKSLIQEFSVDDTIAWMNELGFECFEGSSFKVFPKEFKSAKILKKIKDFLEASEKFTSFTNHKLIDFDENYLFFENKKIFYKKAIFAFGGASWKTTGSDGVWLSLFKNKSINVTDFDVSNCGFKTSLRLDKRLPLKNIAVTFKDKSLKGEALLCDGSIEGGVIYSLSSFIRESLKQKPVADIFIDFMPNISIEDLHCKLEQRESKKSWSSHLKKNISLDQCILKIITNSLSKEDYFDSKKLVLAIKNFKLSLSQTEDMDKAISVKGGVCFDEVKEDFSLKKFPEIFVAGEMLDWEAPTGGFLIQGCYSISFRIVCSLIKKSRT